MSGFEIVGLALGVFPVVVSGLKFYTETFSELWRYKFTLKSLVRELKMENCKFKNTCNSLLEDMITLPEPASLMGSLGEALWKDEYLQEKLEDRLGPEGKDCFMEAVKELQSALEAFQNDFKLVRSDQPEPTDKVALRRKMGDIKLALKKKEYMEQLSSIAKINSDLIELTGQTKFINCKPASASQMIATTKKYKRIRSHSKHLYQVLKETLYITPACACTTPHSVNLRLELRGNTAGRGGSSQEAGLRFHVVICSARKSVSEDFLWHRWGEMGLEPVDYREKPDDSDGLWDKNTPSSTAPPPITVEDANHTSSNPSIDPTSRPSLWQRWHSDPTSTDRLTKEITKAPISFSISHCRNKSKSRQKVSFQEDFAGSPTRAPSPTPKFTTEKIMDLCGAIEQANCGSSCLGVFVNQDHRNYRVWPPQKPPSAHESTVVVSLGDILSQSKILELTTKDRLILGVQLASAVMQLHATEWLSENWDKRDILFALEDCREEGRRSDIGLPIRKPFVRGNFASQNVRESINSVFIPRDQSIFSLGLILIELWYDQCLEDLQTQEDIATGATNFADYVTAKRLAKKLYDDAGEKYGTVANQCITGLGGIDRDLTTDSFKEEVHKKVFCPLVENLDAFFPAWRQEVV